MRQLTLDGFDQPPPASEQVLAPGALLLRAYAVAEQDALLDALEALVAQAPLRHMQTPGGRRMSVAMTNCGALGWISDRAGYRYVAADPDTGRAWPALPEVVRALAHAAASRAGFAAFEPDACLVNCYEPGAQLALHQDRDERDFAAPIVSVSLGLPAVFLFGGLVRRVTPQRVPLLHGDVVVWGGPARLRFHGIAPLAAGEHARVGARRFNLTLRKAG
jgi:alkylated DNA repair protein (DNA oxidative demethylase)